MMVKTKALVIREHIFGESDKFITLFTKDMGRVQVVAPKAKKADKGLASSTQLFVYGDFVLMSYGDTYRLISVDIIEMFHNIRTDLDALSYASYIAEFVFNITQPLLPQKELLKLTLITLQAISRQNVDYNTVRRTYEIRALSLVGFMPQITGCTECCSQLAENDNNYFSASAGGTLCKECYKYYTDAISISYSTYYTLYYILGTPYKQLYKFEIDNIIKSELNKVADMYVKYYVDKPFKTIDFIESISS